MSQAILVQKLVFRVLGLQPVIGHYSTMAFLSTGEEVGFSKNRFEEEGFKRFMGIFSP